MRVFILLSFMFFALNVSAQDKTRNPVIWADVPDISMIRVGDTYYMSSTTMHMNPGVPIISRRTVDWEMAILMKL